MSYPVDKETEGDDERIQQRFSTWDFGLGIEVERMLRDEDCGELSPESGMPCLLAPNHEGRAHVGPHPSGNPGWTVSWA